MSRRFKFEDYEVVWQHSQASGNDLLLLLALVKFRQVKGMYVTKETLAEVMNCNVDTVDRSLKRLKVLGELSWDKGSKVSKRANSYQILLPGLDDDTPANSPRNSPLISHEIPPQTQVLYPRKLTPPNSNETERNSREQNSLLLECLNVDVRVWAEQVNPGVDVDKVFAKFMLHPAHARTDFLNVFKTWIINERQTAKGEVVEDDSWKRRAIND